MDQLFTALGLDRKEKRVFLKLMELGSIPVSLLAKASNLPRSSMYVILERLKKLEVVETSKQKGKIFLSCVATEELERLLIQKQNRLRSALKDFKENQQFLKNLGADSRVIPKVEFLEGKKGIMKAYRRVLKEKSFYSYFNPKAVKQFAPDIFLYIPENLRRSGGKAREFLVLSEEADEYCSAIKSPHHETKILPKGLSFSSDNIICEDKIYFFSYEKDQVCVVEITNKNLAETQRKMFELLWESIK